MDQLNELEQAAICFHVLGGCNDKSMLFRIACGAERYNKLSDKSKGVTVSKWYNLPRIQEGIKIYKSIQERKKIELENEIIAGLETETANQATKNEEVEKTNFLDRDEFLQFLNSRANAITDDKLRNDILKMLSDNLRYKDTERDENNEIQRFYIPVTCENCGIYQRCKGCNLPSCPNLNK
ncbi:MAG: hypothetical protein IJD91_08610 [Clostridia bacterium]|nr:hypothetical protein [Clostridia bacterium]